MPYIPFDPGSVREYFLLPFLPIFVKDGNRLVRHFLCRALLFVNAVVQRVARPCVVPDWSDGSDSIIHQTQTGASFPTFTCHVPKS